MIEEVRLGIGALSPLQAGLLGSLVAAFATGLGALPVFVVRQWSARLDTVLLASAAGIMLGATVFSLLVPALGEAERATGGDLGAVLLVAAGLMLGALGIWLLHDCVPHENFVRGVEVTPARVLGRH